MTAQLCLITKISADRVRRQIDRRYPEWARERLDTGRSGVSIECLIGGACAVRACDDLAKEHPGRRGPEARLFLAMKKPAFPSKDGAKKPLDPREDPLARDSRGKANREEVRKVATVPAARASRKGRS